MTPLILIVGFLGAGKTTFLRKLVPGLISEGLSPSIILNDYQNARVDAELFRELSAAVTPISGSCVCCGSREELRSILLNYRHESDGLLLLEANGTTDARELVATLTSDPELRKFSPPVQISVVDAKRWQKRFWHNELERDQIRTANHLYLGHTDEIPPARLAKVLEALPAALHPATVEDLIATLASLTREIAPLSRAETRCCGHHHCKHSHDHEHHGHHCDHSHEHDHPEDEPHHHDASMHHFAAAELPLPDLISEKALTDFLRGLPPEVLRAKGLARVSNTPERWILFQKVEASDTPQLAELSAPPVDPHPVLILVGPHLPSTDKLLDGLVS